ncbi:3-dehydroquinate synthase [Desulfonema limicola]|uniref:3-dehydroquinate synthase n=1 Tax=Desulfonema limicola TaxID=45656 RepID=A0A975B9X7_9BACT|nr:3-dehydroquinate synthase [Desulfonema limicola]QTA81488.1 3-dehydroquinate synthase [Desulfonema limicola]
MKTLEIHGSTGKSTLMIGERLQNLGKYIPENTIIITDTNVRRLFQDDFPKCEVIEIGTGEAVKNLDTIKYIFERLVELEADRSVFIAGIGGGIVCDITGFAASTYLRGVGFGFVSTTLLSQVDASTGGKNGVNFSGYKNMVGVFNQPEFVICDMNLLDFLPEKEIQCGFAEIVKHGAIADAQMFSYIEENYEKALKLDKNVIEKLVFDSVIIKSNIVNQDEKEKGERRKLNFGHTFGHAVEKIAKVPHGQAVSAGMVTASALSVKKGYLKQEQAQRIENLLKNLKLQTRIPVDKTRALDALKRDKKREGSYINFVLLRNIGEAVIEEISIKELEEVINELC